jgi:hypothetical protein
MGVQKSRWDFYGDPSKEPIEPQGLEQTDVYEFLLWQRHILESYNPTSKFNDTLEHTVAGLGQPFVKTSDGTYAWNETFFMVQKGRGPELESIKSLMDWSRGIKDHPASIVSLADPIGLRCQVASTLGTAELNPIQSSFRGFEMTPLPLVTNLTESPASRLGKMAMDTLRGQYLDILGSVDALRPDLVQNSVQYRSFIQPQMLQESVMLAFGLDALHLMYNTQYKFDGAWKHPNLTTSEPGKILTRGTAGPTAPAILLAIWAVSCFLLSAWYGFRPRWSDSLNGYELFRLGVQMADDVKGQPGYLTARDVRQLSSLSSFPGSVRT